MLPTPSDDPLAEEVAAAKVRARLFGASARAPVIGRYELRGLVGEGGLGVVYAAYDPELERHVALKLVRPGRSAELETEGGQARLIQEARAAGRLSHANVVQVFDVGTYDGRVFFAMELVDGESLRTWLGEGRRTWRDVVSVFADAGRGVAAAHAEKLVHRDFKPDNVLIGPGRVAKVADFGLARVDARALEGLESAALTGLTQTGALMGTPGYMAPELFDGEVADARSDQFAFCVALFEALYGVRPFAAKTLGALIIAVRAGKIIDRDPPRGLPRRVRLAVERGLKVDPEERHASMESLVRELDGAGARRLWSFAAASLVATAAAVTIATQPGASVCDTVETSDLWDDATRSELAALFADTQWARVEGYVDTYADAWTSVRTEACESAAQGERSGADLDRQMACVSKRRKEFHGSLSLLRDPDARVRALQVVTSLAPASTCADLQRLARVGARLPPPEIAAEVDRVNERIAAVEPYSRAGLYAKGFELAEDVLADAQSVGFAPQVLEARYWVAHMLDEVGRADDCLKAADAVFSDAVGSGDDDLAARAAWLRGFVLSYRMRNHAAAAKAFTAAHAYGERIGYEGTLLQAKIWHAEAMALGGSKPDVAMDRMRRALALRTSIRGLMHVDVGNGHLELSQQAMASDDPHLAVHHALKAEEIFAEVQGPEHMDTAMAGGNAALALARLGRAEEALPVVERVFATILASVGPDHDLMITSYLILGDQLAVAERWVAAKKAYAKGVETAERLGRVASLDYAGSIYGLGNVAKAAGDLERAASKYRRAIEIYVAEAPDLHTQGLPLTSLGLIALERGRVAEAVRHLERAVEVLDAPGGTRELDLADAQLGLGRALAAAKDPEGARVQLNAALATLGRSKRPSSPGWLELFAQVHAELERL